MHQFAMDMENIKSITGIKYTLSSYIEHWYVDIFKQYTTSPSYLQTTDWAIQRVILPSIEEDHLLINLTPEYINDILQRCAKLPYRTAGIVSRKILCTILKTAEAEELLDIKFSFESIITFPRIPPKYIAYEKEDICKLLEIAKKSDAIYLEILLCLFAGLRIGEVRGLNYDHVDFQNNTITIMQQIPNESYIEIKTESDRMEDDDYAIPFNSVMSKEQVDGSYKLFTIWGWDTFQKKHEIDISFAIQFHRTRRIVPIHVRVKYNLQKCSWRY